MGIIGVAAGIIGGFIPGNALASIGMSGTFNVFFRNYKKK